MLHRASRVTTTSAFVLLSVLVASIASAAPKKKARAAPKSAPAKFGALAIDRTNGFYYGWGVDHATRAEAEQRAIEEANKRGGTASVVLVWSGTACASYRSVAEDVGTAFGWGVAREKSDADAIAQREAAQRSNGRPTPNNVWGCNAADSGKLEILYDASSEILPATKIGDQVWSTANLRVTTFRNGDPIKQARSRDEWVKLAREGVPAFFSYGDEGPAGIPQGLLYSMAAVLDARGLAPTGWHVPAAEEWAQLVDHLGGTERAAAALESTVGWDSVADATNASGFNAYPGGYYDGAKPRFGTFVNFWSSTQDDRYLKTLHIRAYDTTDEASIGTQDKFSGCYVRLVRD